MSINVELHCHTNQSSDSLMTIAQLFKACEKQQIHKVAITDHNSIKAAQTAVREYPHMFIIGEEIMTKQGEILAYFMREEIPGGYNAKEILPELHAQGVFISVSHPFDRYRKGHWLEANLLQILDQIDAIETFNSRCLLNQDNRKASSFAKQHHLLETIGSDAHTPREVGKSYLRMPDFQDAESFKIALQDAKSYPRLSAPWFHLFSLYAKWKKRPK